MNRLPCEFFFLGIWLAFSILSCKRSENSAGLNSGKNTENRDLPVHGQTLCVQELEAMNRHVEFSIPAGTVSFLLELANVELVNHLPVGKVDVENLISPSGDVIYRATPGIEHYELSLNSRGDGNMS